MSFIHIPTVAFNLKLTSKPARLSLKLKAVAEGIWESKPRLNLIMQPVFISHILFMGQISGLALFKTFDVKGIP